jgi:hypothetical protein
MTTHASICIIGGGPAGEQYLLDMHLLMVK